MGWCLSTRMTYPTQWKAIESISAKLEVNTRLCAIGCAEPRPIPVSVPG